ncbi:MAG: DUF928 domain-containing protein [Cyanobacteria bacterium P01_D01_bin.105]
MTLFKTTTTVAGINLLMLLGAIIVPAIAEQTHSPIGQTFPGRRISGRTRCDCVGKPTVVALIPSNNMAITASSQPALYFLVSDSDRAYPLEFSLHDSEENIIYKAVLTPPENPGMVEVQLPQQALQPNENHLWALSLVYDAENPIQNVVVSGYLRQVTPEHPSLANAVSMSNDQSVEARLTMANRYQAAGLWNDTVSVLAKLLIQYPNDSRIRTSWNQLLRSLEQ